MTVPARSRTGGSSVVASGPGTPLSPGPGSPVPASRWACSSTSTWPRRSDRPAQTRSRKAGHWSGACFSTASRKSALTGLGSVFMGSTFPPFSTDTCENGAGNVSAKTRIQPEFGSPPSRVQIVLVDQGRFLCFFAGDLGITGVRGGDRHYFTRPLSFSATSLAESSDADPTCFPSTSRTMIPAGTAAAEDRNGGQEDDGQHSSKQRASGLNLLSPREGRLG